MVMAHKVILSMALASVFLDLFKSFILRFLRQQYTRC